MAWEYLGAFIVFGSILFLAYVTTKFVGNKTSRTLRGKYINVIESVSIGMDKQLHLVRIAEQYILISSSGKNIEFLTNVNINGYQPEQADDNMPLIDFKTVLSKYIPNMKASLKKESIGVDDSEKSIYGANKNAFSNNLRKLKNITANVEEAKGKDGDENTNEL